MPASAPTKPVSPQTPHASSSWRRWLRGDHMVLVLCGVWSLAVLPFAPGFGSAENMHNIIIALLPLLLVAVGQTLVLISGGIDLSVAAIIGLASVVGATALTSLSGVWAAPVGVIVMVSVGATIGAVNGAAVAWLRMPPFIVTLATMMLTAGGATWFTQSKTIGGLPASFTTLGAQLVTAAPLVAAVALSGHLLLRRTLAGRWIHAVGHNAQTATVSGVPVRAVTWLVYVISGACAGLAAILYTGRLESGSPVHGQNLLLDVIGATVIGGTSLYGGRGAIAWTAAGALFLTLIDNSLNLLNLSYFAIMMVKGGVILLAATMDSMRRKVSAA